MHFSSAFIAAAALWLSPLAFAADEESSSASTSSSTSTEVVVPTFTPLSIKAPFFEQFTDDWQSRWKTSNAKKSQDKDKNEEWAYVGTWEVEEPTVYKGMEGDKGLVLKDKAAHHAISARFPKPIDNKGKTLVVQYEVKLQEGLECGGAYLKLLQDNKALKTEEFSNSSPYIIMFGPDKCGSTNKVHFIFRHKDPKTNEYEEKHMADTVYMKNEKTTTLYQLIVRPDQSFEISVNGESQQNGTLFENFKPTVNPPKEINDPDDKKPDDWVDNAKMPDPDATKPDDWDENEPYQIPDEDAVKPDDWNEDEPEMVPDAFAKKPDDWDDEEDGDWQAPLVTNPKCEDNGCGPWERPTKKNPKYKGKWAPPQIDNPAYKGLWAPRKIPNPDFYEDKNPARFEPMGAIGFELWTMQNDILFDNIYVGHSVEDAKKIKEATFDIKQPIEEKLEENDQPEEPAKPAKPLSPLDLTFLDDPVHYIREKVDLFIELAKRDPVSAVKTVPEVAGGAGLVLVAVLGLLVTAFGAGAKSPAVQDAAKKAKDKAVEAKDKAAEGVTTGAEKVQAEVNKRTTRSAASE